MGAAAVVVPAPAPASGREAHPEWRAPVPGALTRTFDFGDDPFAPDAHRGIDLAARPGTFVGATCKGEVAFAGEVARSRVVTVACGSWRVTHLPLRRVGVRAGDLVRRGDRLGTVAAGASHAGLHVGVRRHGHRFGYVDPWPLLARSAADLPVPGLIPRAPGGVRRPVGPAPRTPERRPRPSVRDRPRATPAPSREALAAAARDGRAPVPLSGDQRSPALAPPLAWVGAALLLLAATHARPRRVRTRMRLHAKEPATRPR